MIQALLLNGEIACAADHLAVNRSKSACQPGIYRLTGNLPIV